MRSKLTKREETRMFTLASRFYCGGDQIVAHYGKEYTLDKDGYVWIYDGTARKRDKNDPRSVALYQRPIDRNKKRRCIGKVKNKEFPWAWNHYGNCVDAGRLIQYYLRDNK